MSEVDMATTQRIMDSFEAIFDSEAYQGGTPQRKKFDAFLIALIAGVKYIKQVNESFERGKNILLDNGSIVDDKDTYVTDMVRILGANFYMDRIISEQMDPAVRNEVGERMKVATDAFTGNSLVLLYRVEDDFRLKDFEDINSLIEEGRLADAVSLIFKRDDKSLDEIDEDTDYRARNSLQSYLTIFSFMKRDAIKNYRGRSLIESESYKHSSLFLSNVLRIREEAISALFDSSHPEHKRVSDVLSGALRNPESANISLLYVMNGNTQEMYRKVKRLLVLEEDSEAGKLILEIIDKEIEKRGASLARVQDFAEIGAHELGEDHDYDVQRKRINEIFSYTSTPEYELDGCDVGSDLVIAPSQVNVKFVKGKPYIFEIELHYENEYGEESTMDYSIDCKKGEFEWSLLDDPEVESGYRNTFLSYADSVLGVVLEKAKLIKAAKKRGEELVIAPSTKQRMRGVSNRPKRAPFEGREKVGNIVSDMPLEGERDVEDSHISREIVIPNEEDLKTLLKKLDYADRDIVMTRLQDFNERGVGRINVLKKGGNSRKSIAGNALGKLVITGKNGGSKGIRVLVERAGAIQGSETWEVVAIDYKGNIYGGNKLDKI